MDVEEWVHCRAKPGVLSLPGLLPPPAPAGAIRGEEEEEEGEGSQCTTCPAGGRRELPECQSGFSPKTPATPAALDQFGTQAGQRERVTK